MMYNNDDYWFYRLILSKKDRFHICIYQVYREKKTKRNRMIIFRCIQTRVPNVSRMRSKWQWRKNKIFVALIGSLTRRRGNDVDKRNTEKQKIWWFHSSLSLPLPQFFSPSFVRKKNWFPTSIITVKKYAYITFRLQVMVKVSSLFYLKISNFFVHIWNQNTRLVSLSLDRCSYNRSLSVIDSRENIFMCIT